MSSQQQCPTHFFWGGVPAGNVELARLPWHVEVLTI